MAFLIKSLSQLLNVSGVWEMKQFKALIIFALLGLSASACAPKEKEHEAFLQIDGPFQDYVHNFEQAAGQNGSPLQIVDLVVAFGSTPSLNETGVCEWAENETPRVIINARIWATLNDYDRQEVIFHELGHCVLRRIHQTTEMMAYNNTMRIPSSVMYPYRIVGTVYRDNMVHYHGELFDAAKRNQF
jgi:Zn-dependent protease with chaperone function